MASTSTTTAAAENDETADAVAIAGAGAAEADPKEVAVDEQQQQQEDEKEVPTTAKATSDNAKEEEGKGEAEAVDAGNEKASEKEEGPPVKRAKIAMPPAVAPSLLDVDEYQIEMGDDEDIIEKQKKQNEDDISDGKKITNPSLILFGLHPLIKEGPLKKTLQKYGNVTSITVRSAFASRYGSVTYETTEEAQSAYKALNGFSIFHKKMLVQPGQQSADTTKPST
mmetsp:Transcript_25485/g.60296  ORF Transcript_25485/g.60296 Transcript_25485/m.60296 type:complete len:225 (-) Transcript_25485:1242-1916(-)|eukprot:CAMPEP_0113483482 /NCGR_PEP_ID=MMETSP0014_2-20120614/23455_1 /TAXON_ID=2857 /ORGANISM="Nitzschia sp." /LENGTH=224 /DNA_ID=CAMNT_0000377027 /DNA_START=96 /DNA_END=770 /DNA_ORIENTATION=+ /assembly_acc=CAM_ASM_000159